MDIKEFDKPFGGLKAKPAWFNPWADAQFQFHYFNQKSWDFKGYLYKRYEEKALKNPGRELSSLESEKEEAEFMRNAFVDLSFITWKNVKRNGVPYEFSKERAKELFEKLPELFDKCFMFARNRLNFEDIEEVDEDKVGKS